MRTILLSPLRLISIGGVLLVAAFSAGCATITKSESQPVAFSSEPQGATVSINGVPSGITPVTIMVTRKYGDQMCAIAHDGYQTEQFKPMALGMNIVEGLTPERGTVLDTFMGSANLGEACHKLGRSYIGIETDEKLFNNAVVKMKGVIAGNLVPC